MIVIGIDPGLDGAIAYRGYGSDYRVADAPSALDGKHRVLLSRDMKALLEDFTRGEAAMVYIERVHSMPHQGVASSFNFGEGYGIWQGIIVGLGLVYTKVTPQRWQKEMLSGMQGGKDAARIRAQELFPDAPLSRKKDHGRADALLIAEYGWRRSAG